MAQQGAAPVIAIERYRVEHGDGFTMPVVSLTDRRAAVRNDCNDFVNQPAAADGLLDCI